MNGLPSSGGGVMDSVASGVPFLTHGSTLTSTASGIPNQPSPLGGRGANSIFQIGTMLRGNAKQKGIVPKYALMRLI